MPPELFDDNVTEWVEVAWGRWAFDEHISLGEMRSVVFLCQFLAAVPQAHRRRYFVLEDNWAVTGASHKGRSGAPLLNFLLRRKAAAQLASDVLLSLPWVQTSLQPADALSRVSLHEEVRSSPAGPPSILQG